MKLCSIASGSSGNCIYVGSEDTHLLVDTGISKKRIEAGLSEVGLTGDDINGILITHEHSDHIQGLGVFLRKYKVPVYASTGTMRAIRSSKSLGKLPEEMLIEVANEDTFVIGDIEVEPFAISHDSNEPFAYRMNHADKCIAVATDLGVYDDYIIEKLSGLDAILLEANHDVHMLEVGPYPYPLKRRVLGDHGHLSNELTGRLLCDILHEDMKYIVLGHLSKENNYPNLAYETVKLELSMGSTKYEECKVDMHVALRDSVSQVFQV